MTLIPNEECKTLVLTGASRGIGYAAVRRPIELHINGCDAIHHKPATASI